MGVQVSRGSLISNAAIDLIESASSETSAVTTGRAFFTGLQPYGVAAIFARAYRGGTARESEQVYSRISPPGWEGLYDESRFRDSNFLIREVRRTALPFQWTEVRATSVDREIWGALANFGFSDGLATPCHGPGGYVGVVSLGFERLTQISPAEKGSIQFASLVLHNRMRALGRAAEESPIHLSARERDCLAFIAEGKSDWDISVLLGVSHTTVISHVGNAKRKLGASTRAQAVAMAMTLGLI